MPRLLLLISLLFAVSAQAAQSIDPSVFKALERAQSAQEKGDYGAAHRALKQAEAKPGSAEEALLWRSRAYLAWAEGNNRQALELLDKAIASGKLDEAILPNERLNLAKLNLIERRYAKVINFGLIYGMGAFGLASNLGIEQKAARDYIDRYFARYPGVKRYMDETRRQAAERGYVETVFGRRLYLPEIQGGNGPRRAGAERQAINAPMQGTAADLIKLAMISVQHALEDGRRATKMVMQVHDELVLEVPDAELEWARAELPRLMAGVATLKVPLLAEVGVGRNWDEAH